MNDRVFSEEGGHEVNVINRERLLAKGVLHVNSFDDEEVVLDTEMGTLTIRGEDLHIKELSLEQGSFSVEGLIVGLQYSSGRTKGKGKNKGIWDKLLK